jgi:hypothetical protein
MSWSLHVTDFLEHDDRQIAWTHAGSDPARYAHLASDSVKQAATKISNRVALALSSTAGEPSAKKVQNSDTLIDDASNCSRCVDNRRETDHH